jgi:pyruvate dehydrogenase complex dehydrogenase (E1) component
VYAEGAIPNFSQQASAFVVYPNPALDRIFVDLKDKDNAVYYITVYNSLGHTVLMLPQPELSKGIDISAFAKGIYFVQLMDKKTKSITTQRFEKL